MERNLVALYAGERRVEVKEVQIESPPDGYVLMETHCSGICGSDLHSYRGEWEQGEEFASGHEASGEIMEVGRGVERFREGDRVTFECFSHCGSCHFCRIGEYNHCLNLSWTSQVGHGGFARYSTVHESSLFKLPDEMSYEEGALVEPLAVGYRAIARSGAKYSDRLAIIGGGTIGLCCLFAAIAAGVKETLIAVKYDHQRKMAAEIGADCIVQVGNEDLEDSVKRITDGRGMDAVIETVGIEGGFDTALTIVRRQGAVVLLGGYFQSQQADLGKIVSSEALITGSNCYGMSGMAADFESSIDLIRTGMVDVKKLVTHRFPLEKIADAFDVAERKESGSIKVHICH